MLTTEEFRKAAEAHPYVELELKEDTDTLGSTIIPTEGTFEGSAVRNVTQQVKAQQLMNTFREAVKDEYPEIASQAFSTVDPYYVKKFGFRSDTIQQVFASLSRLKTQEFNLEKKSLIERSQQTLKELQEQKNLPNKIYPFTDGPSARLIKSQARMASSQAPRKYAQSMEEHSMEAEQGFLAEKKETGFDHWNAKVTWNVEGLKKIAEHAKIYASASPVEQKTIPSPEAVHAKLIGWTPQALADREKATVILKVAQEEMKSVLEKGKEALTVLENYSGVKSIREPSSSVVTKVSTKVTPERATSRRESLNEGLKKERVENIETLSKTLIDAEEVYQKASEALETIKEFSVTSLPQVLNQTDKLRTDLLQNIIRLKHEIELVNAFTSHIKSTASYL